MTDKAYEAELSAFFRHHRYVNEAVVRALIVSGDAFALRCYLSKHGIADDPPMPPKAEPAQAAQPVREAAQPPPTPARAGPEPDRWAETRRYTGIITAPEAARRQAAARRLADSGVSVEAARRQLASLPYEPRPAWGDDSTVAAVGVRPDQAQPTGPNAEAKEVWGKVTAALNGGTA